MLGNDRFAFETPNVIDPGDLPPSRPRNSNQQSTTASTADSSDDDYQEARNTRLINDISDLELSPVKPQGGKAKLPFRDFPRGNNGGTTRPYSPYDDDEYGGNAHSLPAAEEARLHAKALLQQQQQYQERQAFQRTMKLKAPRFLNGSSGHHNDKHLVRTRVLRIISRWAVYLAIGVLVLGLVFGVQQAVASRRGGGYSRTRSDKERYHDILAYLSENGVSSEADLMRNGSPQNIALNWATTDPLHEAVPTKVDGQVNPLDVMLVQRYVLAVLYFSTGGPSKWDDKMGFTSNSLECSWNKLISTPGYITPKLVEGVSCDTDMRVTTIFIPQNGLQGSLPSELQYLPHLDVVNFQDNRLTDNIPDEYGNLYHLLYFNLNNNTMTGSIPDFLGNWRDLQVLGLALNNFEGTLPQSLGLMSRLKTLALSGNKGLSGALDIVSSLSSLIYLFAAGCSFAGRVEDNFFHSMESLQQVDLSSNSLSGKVPLDILLHERNLEVLDLAHNNFEGSFPVEIDRNIATTYISLRNNRITGTLPVAIASLETLDHLDLQGNQMTGFLPNTLGSMVSLTYLFLGENSFEDLVPPLSQLSELRILSLGNLGITGQIMNWLVYLGALELLDLSHNQFTGAIPQNLMNLPTLKYLMLNDNKLVGPMPTAGMPLEVLSLQRNAIDNDADFGNVCKAGRDVFTDCSASCDCCGTTCCKQGDDSCGRDVDDQFLQGLDYTMSFFAFDPDVLDEAGFVSGGSN